MSENNIHSSKILKFYIKSKQEKTLLEWSTKSPDINPIENIWGIMKRDWTIDRNKDVKLHCQRIW